MDRSETVARDHLVFRGFEAPVYEPDGNIPPDFLLNGRIAVEVRRLNENERGAPTPKGLEETEIPLLMGLQKLARSFKGSGSDAWWLRVRYRRPVPPWKDLVKPMRAFLENVSDTHAAQTMSTQFANVELEAIPRADPGGEMFNVAIMSDGDSGGLVLEELEHNLRICIDEKTRKVREYRSRYPEWWLLLIDQISYGLSEFDRVQFKQHTHIEHTWDKVVVVNPLDHTHYFEL